MHPTLHGRIMHTHGSIFHEIGALETQIWSNRTVCLSIRVADPSLCTSPLAFLLSSSSALPGSRLPPNPLPSLSFYPLASSATYFSSSRCGCRMPGSLHPLSISPLLTTPPRPANSSLSLEWSTVIPSYFYLLHPCYPSPPFCPLFSLTAPVTLSPHHSGVRAPISTAMRSSGGSLLTSSMM